jgi:hypothetical protein
MGLFGRSKHKHEAADPLEAADVAKELGREGVLEPEGLAVSPFLKPEPGTSDVVEEELLASADPEDDTTRELLIEREKREQGPDY